jgi:biopolymer transport protein ExbB/TolQ
MATTSATPRRSSALFGALFLGLPFAFALLACMRFGIIEHPMLDRYLHHGVQQVTLIMFFCAVGTLVSKLLGMTTENRAFQCVQLPTWNGRPVSVSESPAMLAPLRKLSRRIRQTYLCRRVEAVLDFVLQRGSAAELDDQIRTLSDNDVMNLEGSYGLTRFITWAIPILGFLGTVLGITDAISGVDTNKLEGSGLNQVTGGLSEAFDSTALALALTMLVMFLSYLVERIETSLMERIDSYVDQHLLHRFVRMDADAEPFIAAVQHNSQILLQATEQLVRQQAAIWSQTMAESHKQHVEVQAGSQQQLTHALHSALEDTLNTHAERLDDLENQSTQRTSQLLGQINELALAVRDTGREQQKALVAVAGQIQTQAQAMVGLKEQETYLLQLQQTMEQNLTALAGAGAFEEAVHSLTAAIHLLMARSSPPRPYSAGGTSSGPQLHPIGKVA